MKKGKKCTHFCAWMLVCILTLSGGLLFYPQTAEADMVSCGTCGGSGKVLCIGCSGSGQKSCMLCGGTGGSFVSTPKTTYTYTFDPITHMMRSTPVTTFTQTRQSCAGCGGSGRSICSTCFGSGRSTCYRCGGIGRVSGGGTSTQTKTPTDTEKDPVKEEPKENSSPENGSSDEEKTAAATVKNGAVLDATDGIGDYEDAPNLLDGKTDTKFNFKATSGYIMWKAPKLIKVTSYVITTGNDNATYTGRNPKTWVLYGSNKKLARNSKSWKVVHSVKDDTRLKDENFKKYTYKLKSAAKAYQYYKLEILENKGSDCTQMTEFTLKGKIIKAAATSLSSVKRSGTSLKVKWAKKSGVTGYQIQYSTSSKFKKGTKVTVKGASKSSKTIKNLTAGKKYYVRIRTYRTVDGATVYSAWSKKKVS